MRARLVLPLLFALAASLVAAQPATSFLDSPEAYFGQERPGDSPVVFAPGLVSLADRSELSISFSPDGKQCVIATGSWPEAYAYASEFKDGAWTELRKAWFSEKAYVYEPSFSPDGKRVYYSSAAGGADTDIFYTERTETGWGDPVRLGPPVNTGGDEFHPCVAADGSLYFSDRRGVVTLCRLVDGVFQPRVALPAPINLPGRVSWGDAFLPPDESLVLIKSNRAGGVGSYDNWVIFKNPDGTWSPAKNLGPEFNSRFDEIAADLSPDGKYLFFGKDGNIYWAKADFLSTLK